MFRRSKSSFLLLIIFTLVVSVFSLPEQYPINISLFGKSFSTTINPPTIDLSIFGISYTRKFKTSLGLDLSGGTELVLEADMSKIVDKEKAGALESAREVIERRVNFFGVSEPVIQTSINGPSYRILVELPGISNVETAVSTIGQTAELEFREWDEEKKATDSAHMIPTIDTTIPSGLTGRDLKRAMLSYSSETGEPEVSLEFTDEGANKFEAITQKLLGKPLPVFLDDFPLTWPTVTKVIPDGKAVITGNFTRDNAKILALQINAGALPIPVSVVQKHTIGATLGQSSIEKSLYAGFVGLFIVAVYMITIYGWLGIIADIALIIYGLTSLTIFRLIPITLTLPGIAGFLLSIGMAVDANILIFERFKEEKRQGKPWYIAMEHGFGMAWNSIRDANITTLLTCMILYNPGNWVILPSSGLVRGFAATLFIGVIVSLFSGIVVSRTLIRVLYKPKNNLQLLKEKNNMQIG